MNKFVSQQRYPSKTPRTLNRTGYILLNLGDKIKKIIQTYFEQNPDGESVTLEVFKQLGGLQGIETLAQQFNKTPDVIKQDIGLAIPIIGAELYPDSFETCRDFKTGKACSRKTPINAKDSGIHNYTKHRLQEKPTIDLIFGCIKSKEDGVAYQNKMREE